MSDMPAIAEPEILIRPITVAEFHRMGDAGIFARDERVELLDGRLIAVPPMTPKHAYSVRRVGALLQQRFARLALVSTQLPVVLDEWSEPLPDVALIALPEAQYLRAHPTPRQVLVLVEVALSSLRYDAGMKLRAYARRGVREYWIVDLVHQRIDVYREPRSEHYGVHLIFERGASVAPLAFPDEPIAVDEVLPPLA
jgi:Uma2 family endonuclease